MNIRGYYAGIGSRETPQEVLKLMTRIAIRLEALGWVLRSGRAPGADQAFESGCNGLKQIFLPWPGFEKEFGKLYDVMDDLVPSLAKNVMVKPLERTYAIAEKFHPAWARLSRGARALQARNVHQILGPDIHDPHGNSYFVVCWTPDGAESAEQTSAKTGGTGQAIRIASHYNVPVFNLKNKDALDRLHGELE